MNALRVVPKTKQHRQAEPHEIKRALQHLIGSFPNSSKKEDLSIYAVSLFDDVVAAKPTVETLTEACRRLRRSCDFLPSIKAVLDALDAAAEAAQPIADTDQLGDVGKLLLAKFGPKVFQSWFAKLVVVDERGPELILGGPNRFICSRIERDFVEDILRCWQQVNPLVREIRIVASQKAANG